VIDDRAAGAGVIVEHRGSIAVVRLAHGKANAMDLEFCTAIAARVGECDADPSIAALLITGQAQIFSAGVDLVRMVNEGAAYVRRFLPALSASLQAVFACAKPVVAAVNGHAIAGGCILACAADYRVMARGSGRIGIPELIVGVPFPIVPIEIMRFVAPANRLQRVRERKRAGSDVGRVLAEAVPGDKRRRDTFRRQQPVRRDARREDRRLRVLGQRQLVLGTFETELAERLAQRRVCLGKRLRAHGKRVGERLAHADLLRTLTREDECQHAYTNVKSRCTRSMKPVDAKR